VPGLKARRAVSHCAIAQLELCQVRTSLPEEQRSLVMATTVATVKQNARAMTMLMLQRQCSSW
jgi:hypothetical protein